VSCNCATAFREGNNILGVYACDIGKPPVAMRYLVDDKIPGVIGVDKSGKKFKVSFVVFLFVCKSSAAVLE